MAKKPKAAERPGSFVIINGKRLGVKRHKTDFSVQSPALGMGPEADRLGLESRSIASKITRIRVTVAKMTI